MCTPLNKTAALVLLASFLFQSLWAQENLFKIVSPEGKTIQLVEYDKIGHYSNGLASVTINNYKGYIDINGNQVIPGNGKPFIFEEAFPFAKNGLALVKINGLYGYIDKTGKEIIKPAFEEAQNFEKNSKAAVKLKGKWGVIDKMGVLVVPAIYESVKIDERHFILSSNQKYAIADQTGKLLTEFKYDKLGAQSLMYKEGLVPFLTGNKWGFLNAYGKEVIPARFDKTGQFNEGFCTVLNNSKIGYINKKGVQVIDFIYNSAGVFSEGLATVMIGNKWGYIDTTGKIKIEPQYESAYDFYEGIAYVSNYSGPFHINKQNIRVPDRVTKPETPTYKAELITEKGRYTLTYINLGLKVDKYWENNKGNASDGKIYDIATQKLIGENVIFYKGKIIEGKFYSGTRTLYIKDSNGITLSQLKSRIKEETLKPETVLTEKEQIIKRMEEWVVDYKKLLEVYPQYRSLSTEFDINASTEEERKSNQAKKIKPFTEMANTFIKNTDFLLANTKYLSPEAKTELETKKAEISKKLLSLTN